MKDVISNIIIAAVSAFVAFCVSWGYNMRSQEAVSDKLHEHSGVLGLHTQQIAEHLSDTDAHWTPRERDALTKQIDRIDGNVQKLIERGNE